LRSRRYFQSQSNKTGRYYHVNQRIHAEQLRVIGPDGSLVGVISKEEALQKAQDEQLDLVLIAANAKPPVAKITDFKKFLYEEEKKQKEAKKGSKKSNVKDIKISLFIGIADRTRLSNKTIKFLDDGHQVRLNLTLKGREIVKRQMAHDLMNSFIKDLGEVNISKEPRLEGRVMRAVVSKKK